jgi:uncharacterized repeat protein (TIGR01451 family)
MKRTGFFFSALFIFLSFFLVAQDLEYEVGVLDLNTKPKSGKDLENVLVVGDNIFYTVESSPKFDLYRFDGHQKQLLLSNHGEITFLQPFKNGFFLETEISPSNEHLLYYYDIETSVFHQLIDAYYNTVVRLTILGDKVIFATVFGVYTTDGSAEGTHQLRRFPSPFYRSDFHSAKTDSLVIFSDKKELWRTDGTLEGSFKLSNITPSAIQWENGLHSSNNLVFYETTLHGLWVTDGSVEGTLPLTEESNHLSRGDIFKIANGIMFPASTSEHGYELWVSDGSVEGTHILIDLLPGPGNGLATPSKILYENGVVFFKGGTEDSYTQLWKSDGALEGTIPILEFDGVQGYNPRWNCSELSTARNGNVFLMTDHIENQNILWNLSDSLTEPLDLGQFPKAQTPKFYHSLNKTYIKFFNYPNGNLLWVTDGTKEGTLYLETYRSFDHLGVHNDLFYFTPNSDSVGYEPFVSNGTVEGTRLLKDLQMGRSHSHPSHFFEYKDTPVFFAADNAAGQAFFATDGTVEGTKVFLDLYPDTYGADLGHFTAKGGRLYFTVDDTLWISQGALDNTYSLNIKIEEIANAAINGRIFFEASDGSLWSTNGTEAGTQYLLSSDQSDPYPLRAITRHGDLVYFFYNEESAGNELWKSDGTKEGTSIAYESKPGIGTIFDYRAPGYDLRSNGEFLFFTGWDEQHGSEPWVSDGTQEGTKLLMDFYPGDRPSYISPFVSFKDKIFFSFGGLWMSDGTEEGTVKIKEGVSPRLSPRTVLVDNGQLLFSDGDENLWKTDGTTEGTVLFKSDEEWYDPKDFTQYGERVVFSSNHPVFDKELWITDGSSEGTYMIKDIEVGKDANPGNFTVVEDYGFFSTHKIDRRNKLWITDGSEENTRNTEILNDADVNPTRLNLFRGKLFFIAENPVYGTEIHYLDFNTPESVQGNVYHDVNENGRKDPEEKGINNQVVLATSDRGFTAQTFTGLKGDFAFYPQSAVFEISPLAGECWELSSEPDYYRVNVDTGFASGLNFGFKKVIDHEGVNVTMSSGPVRCGFTVPFWLNVYNTGCQLFSGEISLDLGTLAEVMSYDVAPTVNQHGRVSWKVDALDESAVFQVKLLLKIPGEEFVGDNVEMTANAFILREDGLAFLDEFTYRSIIRCAIDPNDKQVLPARPEESNSNYTQRDETLTYTIRFQNTGTDTAFTVKIRDELPDNLDPSTFLPITGSHPFEASIDLDGKVEFLFSNILLPDSSTNEVESHGFVQFQINFLPDSPEFSKADNKVGIYFDYNGPVITNTVTNTLVSFLDFDQDGFFFWTECNDRDSAIYPGAEEIPDNDIDENCDGELATAIRELDGAKFNIYPNPANTRLIIEQDEPSPHSAKIYNLLGHLILEITQLEPTTIIDMSGLPSGLYILEIRNRKSQRRLIEKIEKVN